MKLVHTQHIHNVCIYHIPIRFEETGRHWLGLAPQPADVK